MNQTKEELLKIIDDQKATIHDLEERLNEKSVMDRGSSQPGWLIRTKNAGYTGRMLGILFEGGRAFLPANHPEAKAILRQFTSDFGYEATEITSDKYEPGKATAPAQTLLDKLSTPHVMA